MDLFFCMFWTSVFMQINAINTYNSEIYFNQCNIVFRVHATVSFFSSLAKIARSYSRFPRPPKTTTPSGGGREQAKRMCSHHDTQKHTDVGKRSQSPAPALLGIPSPWLVWLWVQKTKQKQPTNFSSVPSLTPICSNPVHPKRQRSSSSLFSVPW